MTGQQLSEIEARANAATPGPWEHCGCGEIVAVRRNEDVGEFTEDLTYGYSGEYGDMHGFHEEADAEFVAFAREDLPRLVAEVRRLRAALVTAALPQEALYATEMDGTALSPAVKQAIQEAVLAARAALEETP